MAVYAIGDIQGCQGPLNELLAKIGFGAGDQLWFCGDLINRGPNSLETLRFVKGLGERAVTVLGNHDLHFLAVAHGYGKYLPNDTLDEILAAPDRDELVHWLRHRPLMHHDAGLGYAMVHAGLPPQWDLATALGCARELEGVLQGPDHLDFIRDMYGNEPDLWSDELQGLARWRFITNCFSRMRFCDGQGRLNLKDKGAPGSQRPGYMPWFEAPGRKTAGDRIVFGHWSTLGTGEQHNVLALDGGCLWGGSLVAVRLDCEAPQWCSVACDMARRPGED